jgi:hypothetical protein
MSTEQAARNPEVAAQEARTLRSLAWVGLCTVVAAVLGLLISQMRGIPGAIGIGALIVLTSAAIGCILGFLFALPRVLSKDQGDKPASSPDANAATAGSRRLLGSNTNLERVSDWLTTMIVGVGLTQLANVNTALLEFREFIAETARIFPANCASDKTCSVALHAGALPIAGPMLLIFGLVAGFVGFYLFTRLKLSALFLRVERHLDEPLSPADAEGVKEVVSRHIAPGDTESPTMQAVLSSAQPSVDDTISLMYSLLYRTNGYQQVIELGGQLSNTIATKRAAYWFYLAAAFGQKHSALLAQGQQGVAVQSARDNALEAARRAVQIDPIYKLRLLHISDPDGVDDDLAPLRNDPDFVKIVGQKTGK